MHLTPSGSKVVAICVTCEPFALASGLNKMSLNLATPEPKPDARPDASAFGSRQGLHHVTTIVALKIHLLAQRACIAVLSKIKWFNLPVTKWQEEPTT